MDGSEEFTGAGDGDALERMAELALQAAEAATVTAHEALLTGGNAALSGAIRLIQEMRSRNANELATVGSDTALALVIDGMKMLQRQFADGAILQQAIAELRLREGPKET